MKWLQKKATQSELQVKRALPVGLKEFHEWADRIIQGAMLPASIRSQKFSLASIIAHTLGPQTAFENDLFFINHLRKSASNQVALSVMENIKAEVAAEKQNQAQPAHPEAGNAEVLPIK